jgi:hypothetical protein
MRQRPELFARAHTPSTPPSRASLIRAQVRDPPVVWDDGVLQMEVADPDGNLFWSGAANCNRGRCELLIPEKGLGICVLTF